MDIKGVNKMAKTPYQNLSTQDILSGHLSGVQSDINKIQEILDMKTKNVTGHQLNAVRNQDDVSLRYIIYEGNIRNWLDEPTPIIYRNGIEVDASEYELQAPYGLIVFQEQQSSSDTITADFSYIVSESNKIEEMDSKVEEVDSHVSNVDDRVKTLEDNEGDSGGSGELPSNYNILGGVSPFYMSSDSYLSHQKRNYDPLTKEGYNTESHEPAFNTLVYGDTLDVFPFPITTETTFKQAGIMLGDAASSSVDVRIGLYRDNGNLYPGELVFQTDTISVEPDSWGYADINETIPAGLYWIARHDGGTAYWNGLNQNSVINIQKFNAETFLRNLAERPNPFSVNGGYRVTNVSFGEIPSTFPSDIEPFSRGTYGSPWLIIE